MKLQENEENDQQKCKQISKTDDEIKCNNFIVVVIVAAVVARGEIFKE